MKIAAVLSGLIGGAAQIATASNGVLGTIILFGAVIGALAMIWAKAVRPAIRFGGKFAQAVDVLLEMPKWRDSVEKRLDALEGETTGTGHARGRGTPSQPEKA